MSYQSWSAMHLKTGNKYNVVGEAINATNENSGQAMFIYERDGVLFVRCAKEFAEKFDCRNFKGEQN